MFGLRDMRSRMSSDGFSILDSFLHVTGLSFEFRCQAGHEDCNLAPGVPIVSIVVSSLGLSKSIFRIL